MSAQPGRWLVALLLVIASVLFAMGTSIERSDSHEDEGAETSTTAEQGGEAEEGQAGEEGEEGEAVEEGEDAHSESEEGEESETVLGIDVESTPMIVAAVAASILLALATLFVRSRAVLVLVAVFALVFAAGDLRELLHQLDESRTSIAVIAGVLIALHLATAVLAWLRFRQEGGTAEAAAG